MWCKFFYTILFFFSLQLFSCRDIPVNKDDLLGDDFRLFQGTVAWNLAKAVEDQNVTEIKRQVLSLKVPVDYKEEKWNQTLLMMAVSSNKIRSVKCLLALGASPNEHDDSVNSLGETPIIVAARFPSISPKILQLLLDYGGNPNSIECGKQKDNFGNWIPARDFALNEAVFTGFEKVKILVEAGADVNLQTETTAPGAIYATIQHRRMDILLYLLEHGADYRRKFERIDWDNPEHPSFYVDILYKLRFCVYPLDSKEHKDKLKVIDFLR
ncbi:ankyrin repeat protein, partial [Hoylesella saccharolytica F0055]